MDERACDFIAYTYQCLDTFTIAEYEKIASRLEKPWVIERLISLTLFLLVPNAHLMCFEMIDYLLNSQC